MVVHKKATEHLRRSYAAIQSAADLGFIVLEDQIDQRG
jgi:hypothetical protein